MSQKEQIKNIRKLSRTLSTMDKKTLQQLALDIDKVSDSPKYNRRSCPIGIPLLEFPNRTSIELERQPERTGTRMNRRRSRSENSFFDRDTRQATVGNFLSSINTEKATSTKIITLCIYIKNNFFKK